MSCLCWWLPGRGSLTWMPEKPSIHAMQPTLTFSSSPKWPSPQALTPPQRRPFYGKYQQDQSHFWRRLAYLGYGPAPGTHIKKALCHTRAYVGGTMNTVINIVEMSNFFSLGFGVSILGNHFPDSLVLDTSLLNTKHYKVRIKGKVD